LKDKTIAAALTRAVGAPIDEHSKRAVSGGSINQCWRYETARGPLFVKSGGAASADAFACEAAGLQALARTETVRVPKVVACGTSTEGAYLALEWITLGSPTKASEALLGEQLAWQHRQTHARFGWDRDNTIGATAQPNAWCEEWITFLREHRLLHQLTLAAGKGADARTVDRGRVLCELIDAFFSSYRPVPSLLHGDLWGGNWGTDEDGLPVIFDPAVYYGDRETDLAMTELFGGFAPEFYAAYETEWPLDKGYPRRKHLYNLYHLLNHLNLFGGGYRAQVKATLRLLGL
jgi:protein-ribulosamine 3-kinase